MVQATQDFTMPCFQPPGERQLAVRQKYTKRIGLTDVAELSKFPRALLLYLQPRRGEGPEPNVNFLYREF